MNHQVDILDPNTFEKTGETKTIEEAWIAGDWLGTFNLWIVQNNSGVHSLLYQQRHVQSAWAPGFLDVTAGGHYEAGETIRDGLREVREELGKDYNFEALVYLGKKLYVGNQGEYKRRYVVDVFMLLDNSPLDTFCMQRSELEGLYCCPIDDLIKVHTEIGYSFKAKGIKFEGDTVVNGEILVTHDIFPFNWDNYHFKIALLAQRFFLSERYLLY